MPCDDTFQTSRFYSSFAPKVNINTLDLHLSELSFKGKLTFIVRNAFGIAGNINFGLMDGSLLSTKLLHILQEQGKWFFRPLAICIDIFLLFFIIKDAFDRPEQDHLLVQAIVEMAGFFAGMGLFIASLFFVKILIHAMVLESIVMNVGKFVYNIAMSFFFLVKHFEEVMDGVCKLIETNTQNLKSAFEYFFIGGIMQGLISICVIGTLVLLHPGFAVCGIVASVLGTFYALYCAHKEWQAMKAEEALAAEAGTATHEVIEEVEVEEEQSDVIIDLDNHTENELTPTSTEQATDLTSLPLPEPEATTLQEEIEPIPLKNEVTPIYNPIHFFKRSRIPTAEKSQSECNLNAETFKPNFRATFFPARCHSSPHMNFESRAKPVARCR